MTLRWLALALVLGCCLSLVAAMKLTTPPKLEESGDEELQKQKTLETDSQEPSQEESILQKQQKLLEAPVGECSACKVVGVAAVDDSASDAVSKALLENKATGFSDEEWGHGKPPFKILGAHGTVAKYADSICTEGIKLKIDKSAQTTGFALLGQGFYLESVKSSDLAEAFLNADGAVHYAVLAKDNFAVKPQWMLNAKKSDDEGSLSKQSSIDENELPPLSGPLLSKTSSEELPPMSMMPLLRGVKGAYMGAGPLSGMLESDPVVILLGWDATDPTDYQGLEMECPENWEILKHKQSIEDRITMPFSGTCVNAEAPDFILSPELHDKREIMIKSQRAAAGLKMFAYAPVSAYIRGDEVASWDDFKFVTCPPPAEEEEEEEEEEQSQPESVEKP